MRPTVAQILLQQHAKALSRVSVVRLGLHQPEQLVADQSRRRQRAAQQEARQRVVVVRLVLDALHQLQQEGHQVLVTEGLQQVHSVGADFRVCERRVQQAKRLQWRWRRPVVQHPVQLLHLAAIRPLHSARNLGQGFRQPHQRVPVLPHPHPLGLGGLVQRVRQDHLADVRRHHIEHRGRRRNWRARGGRDGAATLAACPGHRVAIHAMAIRPPTAECSSGSAHPTAGCTCTREHGGC
mmetsp:Transcript_12639/g.40377  ORF Transcript_12639/g.40377 Transcript_12639/m.40377 type:complete len:238 (-) Transcript_12639:656-1369(-)